MFHARLSSVFNISQKIPPLPWNLHSATTWLNPDNDACHTKRGYATFETSKSISVFCSSPHRHGHRALTRTVANGCERLQMVARRLANTPSIPNPPNETGTLAAHSEKKRMPFATVGAGVLYRKNEKRNSCFVCFHRDFWSGFSPLCREMFWPVWWCWHVSVFHIFWAKDMIRCSHRVNNEKCKKPDANTRG